MFTLKVGNDTTSAPRREDKASAKSTPEVRNEKLAVGVYGDYGDDGGDGGGPLGNFVGMFNPLFGLCCGGG
jgi:hypothetical protein